MFPFSPDSSGNPCLPSRPKRREANKIETDSGTNADKKAKCLCS